MRTTATKKTIATKKAPKDISARLNRVSGELRKLDDLLKAETTVDPSTLNEFRYELDTARLTAWTVSELLNARRVGRNSDAVLTFLAGERVRRIQQMVRALCDEFEHKPVPADSTDIRSLVQSLNTLQERIEAQARQELQGRQLA